MSKMINCKTCGAPIAASAKSCPACGAKNKKPIAKRPWFWILIVFVFVGVVGSMANAGNNNTTSSSSTTDSESSSTSSSAKVTSNKNTAFEGDCGISASGEMGSSAINYPELGISITNNTDKEITAIKFYAVPYDVYGDEIKGWTSQNNLYTDTAIPAGSSTTIYYQFIEDSVKTVKLYVYSVYYADGTEWGNKDATKSVILENGAEIEVSGQS
jgi:hypothetical protein